MQYNDTQSFKDTDNVHKKKRKYVIYIIVSTFLTIALSAFSFFLSTPSYHYSRAVSLIESGNYKSAYYHLKKCDSPTAQKMLHSFKIEYKKEEHISFSEDGKMLKHATECQFDSRGNVILETKYDKDGSITSEYKHEYDYDDNGRVILKSSFTNGMLSSKTEYRYDDKDKKTHSIQTVFNSDNEVQSVTERQENSNGNLLYYAYTSYRVDGTIEGKNESKLEYNADGKEILTLDYDKNGAVQNKTETVYNENGGAITTAYDKDGNITARRESQYDQSGRLIRFYDYGKDGNLLRKFNYTYNSADYPEGCTGYQYYENGKVRVEELTKYNIDGITILNEVITYDENGVISFKNRSEYNDEGDEIYSCSVEYDENGQKSSERIRSCTYKYKYDRFGILKYRSQKSENGKNSYETIYKNPVVTYDGQ